jgi:hypothetical protein
MNKTLKIGISLMIASVILALIETTWFDLCEPLPKTFSQWYFPQSHLEIITDFMIGALCLAGFIVSVIGISNSKS